MHRLVIDIAAEHGWPTPSYTTVYEVIRSIPPSMTTLALAGDKRYREGFDLVYRRDAAVANQMWQADHTQLDLWQSAAKVRVLAGHPAADT